MEALTPEASLDHATDSDSHMLWSGIKRKPDTASKMKISMPFKQLQGSDGKSSAGIGAILFKDVNDDNDQSQGNDDDADLMILGQDAAITMDAGLGPEQVSKAHLYQWHNDLPWVKEARNALLSQDP